MSASNSRNIQISDARWPSTSHIQAWEQQWLPSKQNAQNMENATNSKKANEKEDKENPLIEAKEEKAPEQIIIEILDSEEENEENKTINVENGNKGNKTVEMGSNAQEKLPSIRGKVYDLEFLEEVLCPWEKIQQFIQICPHDYCTMLQAESSANAIGCMVAFHVRDREINELSEQVFIDEISRIRIGIIEFKHYGALEIHSIMPHYGPISDEDYGKWLDKLISTGEALPKRRTKSRIKAHILNQLRIAISSRIFQNLQQNAKKLFDGIIVQLNSPLPILPPWIDISPIILQIQHLNSLLKLHQNEFAKTLKGLCVQVELSEIKHSLKLPPMMILLNQMLIPISMVTFDAPKRYKIKQIMQMKSVFSNALMHLKNGNGDVICTAKIPQRMILPSEQLIQISLGIWQMNCILMPTSEYIRQKSEQLKKALSVGENVHLTAGLGNEKILPLNPNPLQANQSPQKEDGCVEQKQQQTMLSAENQQAAEMISRTSKQEKNRKRNMRRAIKRALNEQQEL